MKQSLSGPDPHNGGIFLRRGRRQALRGYVVWAGGYTKIGSGTYRGEITLSFNLARPATDGVPPPTVQLTINDLSVQLAPIPEPSSYALLVLGLGGLAYAARRRRSAA